MSPSRRRFSSRNVLSGEARGETAVFAGYIRGGIMVLPSWFTRKLNLSMDWRPHLRYAQQLQNNKHMEFGEISRKVWKRKMRWQKGPLESGDLDENGELPETFIALFLIYCHIFSKPMASFRYIRHFRRICHFTRSAYWHLSLFANAWANFTTFFIFTRCQFNKSFTSVIYKWSYCLRVWKQ